MLRTWSGSADVVRDGAEVSVLTAGTELEAEVAAARLRAGGLRARVVSRSLLPPTVLPGSRPGPYGSFDVMVPRGQEASARDALVGDDGEEELPRDVRQHPILRLIAIAVLLAFLFGAIGTVGMFFQSY